MPCTRDAHEQLKNDPHRVRTETSPCGVQRDGEGNFIGHMRNHIACGSTLMLDAEQDQAAFGGEPETGRVVSGMV